MVARLKKVRLSDADLEALELLFKKHFLVQDRLWLFGSRASMSKKGGDIDLYIETHAESIEDGSKRRSHFLWDLEEKMGEQKIDIVLNLLNFPYPLPIHEVAKLEGVRLV